MTALSGGGLYAITSGSSAHLLTDVAQALAGGAQMLQYRDKSEDSARRLAEAQALLQLCRAHRVPLIINDDVALAAAIGADGVHLGYHDVPVATARAVLGPQAIIGAACYGSLERAQQLATSGADYLGFGAFYPSPTKPNAPRVEVELLRRAATLGLPVVAIGGITPDNGGLLVEAGADYLAAVTGVFGADDIALAASRFAALYPSAPRNSA
jgi:thiamine-phosphate pyrophosphorylase